MKPDVLVELKSLRLHGMAGAWADLVEQGGSSGVESSRWLLEHLLQAETTDRAMRSVSHQMHVARFPVHRDLAGFDFEVSPVDRKLVATLATTAFTDDAHNAVFVGGPGTGKTHLATHLHLDGRGLAIRGSGAGLVLAPYRGLVDARQHDLAARGRRIDDGCVETRKARAVAASLGPRQPIHQRALPGVAAGTGHHLQHEPGR
jgi:hypothetical protein